MPASATRLGVLYRNASQENVREGEGLLEAPSPTSDPTLSAAGLVADRHPRVASRMSEVDRDPRRGQQKASPQPHRVHAVDLHGSNVQLDLAAGQVAKSLGRARRRGFVVRARTIAGCIRSVGTRRKPARSDQVTSRTEPAGRCGNSSPTVDDRHPARIGHSPQAGALGVQISAARSSQA